MSTSHRNVGMAGVLGPEPRSSEMEISMVTEVIQGDLISETFVPRSDR